MVPVQYQCRFNPSPGEGSVFLGYASLQQGHFMSNDTNSKNFSGDPSRISSFLDYLVHINDRMRNENAENLRLFAQLVLKILLFEN